MILNKEKVKEIFLSQNIGIVDIVIILDKNCNANCPLCVAKHVIKNKDCKDLCQDYKTSCKRCCDRMAEDEIFYAEVDDILSAVHGDNVRIMLTGGEPTLSNRLIPTLEILDKYNFGSINIETNGAKLLDNMVQKELHLRNVKVLLSRYCIDDSQNDAEFMFSSDRVAESDVVRIINTYAGLVTMNCILLSCGVSSGEDVICYYEHYKELGATEVNFTEVMFDTTLSASNKSIAEYYKKNHVTIDKLSEELTKLGYEKLQDNGGSFHTILHNYKDSQLSLTAADMSKIAKEKQNNEYYSKYLIYPSGEIGAHTIEDR